jgi:hypothetical protein
VSIPGAPAPVLRPVGAPALRVTDNVVVVPEGRCLLVVGDGAWAVHGNQFTSHGPGTAIRLAGGNPIGLEESYNALGGCAVFLMNNGTTNETGLQLIRFQRLGDIRLEVRREVAAAAFNPRVGKILFNDNQVLLDLAAAPAVPVTSSVLVISRDDISMASNQVIVEQRGDLVSFHLLATASWSIRINDNRFEETLFVDGKLVTFGLSALCICRFGIMTSNEASHCLVLSTTSRVRFANNIEFIGSVGGAPCRAARLAASKLSGGSVG